MTDDTPFDDLSGDELPCEQRRHRWEQVVELPLTIAAFGLLAASA